MPLRVTGPACPGHAVTIPRAKITGRAAPRAVKATSKPRRWRGLDGLPPLIAARASWLHSATRLEALRKMQRCPCCLQLPGRGHGSRRERLCDRGCRNACRCLRMKRRSCSLQGTCPMCGLRERRASGAWIEYQQGSRRNGQPRCARIHRQDFASSVSPFISA